MKNRKLKIFLGGYVNFPNAQNINCDNIARYLDKDKFEVHTMYTAMMPIDKKKYKELDIHLHKVISHRYIWYWMRYYILQGGNYDVIYLPKQESVDIAYMKKHRKGNTVFLSSVEGVITDGMNNSEEYKSYYTDLCDSYFAISECIGESIRKYWNEDVKVLPLGVHHISEKKSHSSLRRIVWAGNIKANKRPQYLVECAGRFPDIEFTMIGDGDMMDEMISSCKEKEIHNVSFTGRIPNEEVYAHMDECDLILMTSEFEGLPKVIQEAAQCGLPCIYMAENYKVDFIEDGVNGYEVYSLEEMIEKIEYLNSNPDIYSSMSEEAINAIEPYSWDILIKKYEEYFLNEYRKKNS